MVKVRQRGFELEGVTFSEAAKLYNINPKTLRDRYKRGDRPPYIYRQKETEQTPPTTYLDEGQTLAEIAASLNMPESTIFSRYAKGDRGQQLRRKQYAPITRQTLE